MLAGSGGCLLWYFLGVAVFGGSFIIFNCSILYLSNDAGDREYQTAKSLALFTRNYCRRSLLDAICTEFLDAITLGDSGGLDLWGDRDRGLSFLSLCDSSGD